MLRYLDKLKISYLSVLGNFKYFYFTNTITMSDYTGKIIGIVIALLLAGILLPIGLDEILAFTSTNATIETLVATVVPIMAIIGIVLMFVVKGNQSGD